MATAVSFFVIIVALAVTAGFRQAIREGVASFAGDIRIEPYQTVSAEPRPMSWPLPSEAALEALPGVLSLDPAVIRPGIVKNGDIVHGVVVKGVPVSEAEAPEGASAIILATEGASASEPAPLAVSIPYRLAEITGLGVGDPLVTYFVGEKVRVRKFTISALHRDVLELDDQLVVYAPLEDLQRLNGWDSTQVSCLDVRLRPGLPRQETEQLAGQISSLLLNSGHPEEENLYVSASSQRFPQVFDWLELLEGNVLFILVLMTLVAGFNMISGLLIMLLRNISTIGTLKTLGMDNRSIGRLFIRVGAGAVLKGMLAGNALALLFCLIQGTSHLIPLDPVNYYVAWVPVHVNVPAILLADAVCFAVILLLLWLPARLVSTIDPAATVKAD